MLVPSLVKLAHRFEEIGTDYVVVVTQNVVTTSTKLIEDINKKAKA